MPTERHAVCSAFGRLAITGPTSQAAANNSAVLPRLTARYSSSVVAVFFAAASCITSPSAMDAAADDKMSSARSEPTSTNIRKAWPSRKSPTSPLASLPHSTRDDSLPPDEIRWLATSGIMVTSEPVRDRMVALTRSMSAATSPTSWSIEALDGLSKGTITATLVSTFAQFAMNLGYNNRKCGVARQGHPADNTFRAIVRPDRQRRAEVAGIGSDQRYRAGFSGWRAARRRQDSSPGAGSEYEHHRGLARGVAAPDPGP